MDQTALDQHLSQIATMWTTIFQAHQGSADAAKMAQQRLLERYQPAVYKYLLAAVRDADVADELSQEFALRFVRGDFKRADPQRGRFRSFLKTALYHLIVDHQRRQQRRPLPLPEDGAEPAAETPSRIASDEEFLTFWRAELLDRTWKALQKQDRENGQHLYTVLRYQVDHPETRSAQMAEQLAPQVGKPITAEWIYKRLYHARRRFTDLLLEEVAHSLENSTEDELEQELIDLGLFQHCQEALQRRRAKT